MQKLLEKKGLSRILLIINKIFDSSYLQKNFDLSNKIKGLSKIVYGFMVENE